MVQKVVVSYAETYDLSTKQNRMSILGIHTPAAGSIQTAYGGLSMNFKYMRLLSCDVTLACASMLPLDPLGIGVGSNEVAPQDIFNPIIYRATTTDGFNAIVNHVYGQAGTPIGTVNVGSQMTTNSDDFMEYYALLNSSGWKKAMPQAGLTMRGLYPMCYQVVNSFGNDAVSGAPGNLNVVPYNNNSGAVTNSTIGSTYRGPSMRMPRLPTWQATGNSGISQTTIPTTYVATICMPPSANKIMYYRLRVVWHVEFSDPITTTEHNSWADLRILGVSTYATDYDYTSKSMENISNTVDTNNANIALIMSDGGVPDGVQPSDGGESTPQIFE